MKKKKTKQILRLIYNGRFPWDYGRLLRRKKLSLGRKEKKIEFFSIFVFFDVLMAFLFFPFF